MIFPIILLTFIDQGIKIMMNLYFKEVNLEIVGNNMLGIRVFLNRDRLSIFNSEGLDLELSLPLLILMNIVILIVLLSIYLYFQKNNFSNIFITIIFILLISATISSTIDRVFWGGSLDFIVLLGYIVDLKDLYAVLGTIIVVVYILGIEFKFIKEDLSAISTKEYFLFIKDKLINIFK